METTTSIMGLYRGYIGCILGLYGHSGKENGDYRLGGRTCEKPPFQHHTRHSGHQQEVA